MNKNSLIFALTIGLAMSGCASGGNDTATEETTEANETTKTTSNTISKEDITVDETYENSADGEHAISVEGEEKTYENIQVNKTGNASGDEADFYGENAAVFATEKGTLTISKSSRKRRRSQRRGRRTRRPTNGSARTSPRWKKNSPRRQRQPG